MNRTRAFTVIELLVVIAIVGIILGITIPRFTRSSAGTQLKATTESIKELLETAKSYAIAQHTNCAVIYDSGAAKVYLAKKDIDDADNDGDTDEMIQFDRGMDVPSGITLQLTADNQVEFTSWGSVANPDDTITVSNPSLGKQKVISINTRTGYIQVS